MTPVQIPCGLTVSLLLDCRPSASEKGSAWSALNSIVLLFVPEIAEGALDGSCYIQVHFPRACPRWILGILTSFLVL